MLKPETVISDSKDSTIQILVVSSRGTWVKSESTSNDAIKQCELWQVISLANSDELLSVYSKKNLAQPYVTINS